MARFLRSWRVEQQLVSVLSQVLTWLSEQVTATPGKQQDVTSRFRHELWKSTSGSEAG